MALEYSLYLANDFDHNQALEFLFGVIGVEPNKNLTDQPGVIIASSGHGFTTFVQKTSDERRSFLMEELGIEVAITILFRMKKEDREAQKNVILRATVELLRHVIGDAALIFNGEVVYLLRIGDQLILNNSMGLWDPAYLAFVTQNYTMNDIPTL